jgi:hypothetical protein
MNIIFSMLLVCVGLVIVMAIVVESIEKYYKIKRWYDNEN